MTWTRISQNFLTANGFDGDRFKVTHEIFSDWEDGGIIRGTFDGRLCEVYVSCGECDDWYMEGDEPDEDDSWSDGDSLASAGWGTDEDYGGYDYGDEDCRDGDSYW